MTKYEVIGHPMTGTPAFDGTLPVGATFDADSSDELEALVEQGVLKEVDDDDDEEAQDGNGEQPEPESGPEPEQPESEPVEPVEPVEPEDD